MYSYIFVCIRMYSVYRLRGLLLPDRRARRARRRGGSAARARARVDRRRGLRTDAFARPPRPSPAPARAPRARAPARPSPAMYHRLTCRYWIRVRIIHQNFEFLSKSHNVWSKSKNISLNFLCIIVRINNNFKCKK